MRSPSSSLRRPRDCSPSPGFGPLTAGKLIGEIAGGRRFATDAKLARAGGIAPIPVSSANTNRHRLDRGGNRQINTAIHRVAITRLRCQPETKAYVARKRAEGKTSTEAIRSAARVAHTPPLRTVTQRRPLCDTLVSRWERLAIRRNGRRR